MNLLILLVGRNPIANYALIEYFKINGDEKIPKFDKVILIYTDKTKELVNNIKRLKNDVTFIDVYLKDNARNLKAIKKIILDKINSINNISSIHLNYTGATKSMSIGAYLAVNEYQLDNTIYSDISPSNYKLTLEDGTTYPKADNENLSSNIDIPIEDFYTLHGLSKPKFNKNHSEFYNKKFCMFLLDKCDVSEKDFYEDLWDKKDIKNLQWRESLYNEINIEIDLSNRKLKKLQKFIRGNWLEEYLFDILTDIKDETNITDIAWNIEAQKEGRDFEVDVIAISVYKSFVFTCTTDKNIHIKQKAFESKLRSEQLGGIASKTILISLAEDNNIEAVRKDIHHIEENFYAFGIRDIENIDRFKSKLIKIFQ